MDLGAKCSYVEPDEVTEAFVRTLPGGLPDDLPRGDGAGQEAATVLRFDVGEVVPLVACPPTVGNTKPVSEVAGHPVQWAELGGHGGGRIEDIRAAAEVLAGHQVHPHTRFNIVPSSREVFAEAAREGLVLALHEAGATWFPPSTGSNQAINMGAMASGEAMISTHSRNFPGRNGSSEARDVSGVGDNCGGIGGGGRDRRPRNEGEHEVNFEGRCWKFGDNIPTDRLVKSQYVFEPMDVMAKHVLEDLDPDFPLNVQPGDIVVAGKHFGQSSGRAIATKALKATGIGCVVAETFARTFYRNCFEVGLPALEVRGITTLANGGDPLRVDLKTGVVTNVTTGESLSGEPADPFLVEMLDAGGLIALAAKRTDLFG